MKDGGSLRFSRYLEKLPHAWLRYDVMVEELQQRFGADRVKVMAFEQMVRDQTAYLDELQVFVRGRDEATQQFGAMPRVNQTLAPPTRQVVRVANHLFVTSPENPQPPLRRIGLGVRLVKKLMKLDPVVFKTMKRRLGKRDRELIDRVVHERCAEGNVRLAELSWCRARRLRLRPERHRSPCRGLTAGAASRSCRSCWSRWRACSRRAATTTPRSPTRRRHVRGRRRRCPPTTYSRWATRSQPPARTCAHLRSRRRARSTPRPDAARSSSPAARARASWSAPRGAR